uniref:AlNc14C4G662 protein n=1 Tax=Albugo laibachii Nc14 TaxID=890382 RepID=F0W0M2_9STRA|nr:AlNc14C4G662 [Albugo laibachii Nc14]|eukprot:CCA14594.1 AlNc14C4G662 [Albugo laibachii Nc14]
MTSISNKLESVKNDMLLDGVLIGCLWSVGKKNGLITVDYDIVKKNMMQPPHLQD